MVIFTVVGFREGVRKRHRLDQRMWSVTEDVPQKQASDSIAMGSKALPLWRKSICRHKIFNIRQAANTICHDSSVYVCACL